MTELFTKQTTIALLWLLCAQAAVTTTLCAQEPSSEAADSATDVARAHFDTGIAYYRDGDFEGALVEFKRAMAAQPNYKLLFNLGRVSEDLRDYPGAARYLHQYLEQGGDGIAPQRRAQVQKDLETLAGRIATITLTSNLSGTRFFIDDVPVDEAALDGPIRVSAGRRRVVASHMGRANLSRVIDVAGRETVILHLEFPETEPAAATSTPTPPAAAPREQDSAGVHPAVWTGVASAALLAGGAVMGYLADRDERAYRAELDKPTTRDQLDELSKSAETKALVTDVLLGVGAVGALVTVIVLASYEPESAQAPRARLQIGPGSVGVAGQF